MENCFDFDWTTQTCKRCNSDPQNTTNLYHYQEGFCCPSNFFFNFETLACDIDNQVLNCLDFDVLKGNCLQCKAGYYFSKGNCCQEGQYFDATACKPMDRTEQLGCLIWLDA